MGRPKRLEPPAEVGATLARFQDWRKVRRKGARIPKSLWAEAVVLARQLGVNPVATALGVKHAALKERLSTSAGLPHVPETVTPTFIELAAGAILDPNESNEAGATLEVTASDGARMVVRMPANSAVDMPGLLASFLGRRREVSAPRLAQQGGLR